MFEIEIIATDEDHYHIEVLKVPQPHKETE